MVKETAEKFIKFHTRESSSSAFKPAFFTGRLCIFSGTKYYDLGEINIVNPGQFRECLSKHIESVTGEKPKVWFEIGAFKGGVGKTVKV